MRIKIVQRPAGEAPEWVRDAWIGLHLPLANANQRTWRTLGVISGTTSLLPWLWAIATGKSEKVTGFAVNAKDAIESLTGPRASAGMWWRENLPDFLDGRSHFVFDAEACEIET
jgi:hypothetical protein